eukprot:scaffold1441_cov120-Isochrysis_galbana.AAC.17
MRPAAPIASAMWGIGRLAAAAAACTCSACAGTVAQPTNLATAAAPPRAVLRSEVAMSAADGIGPSSWCEPTIWMLRRKAREMSVRSAGPSRLASRSISSTPARTPTSHSPRYSSSVPSNLPPSRFERTVYKIGRLAHCLRRSARYRRMLSAVVEASRSTRISTTSQPSKMAACSGAVGDRVGLVSERKKV